MHRALSAPRVATKVSYVPRVEKVPRVGSCGAGLGAVEGEVCVWWKRIVGNLKTDF